MAQKNIGTNWNRDNRNNMNHNFNELYGKYDEFSKAIIEDIRDELMEGSKINFIPPVESVDDLPSDANIGDTSFVTTKGEWHRWNGEKWEFVAKTDPSEFISLQDSFKTLSDDYDSFTDSLNNDFESFKESINTTIDDRLGDLQGVLQEFMDNLEGDVVYVEEEGENENGNYIRYSDGMQICWNMRISQATDTKTGNVYTSGGEKVMYPKEFSSSYPVSTSAIISRKGTWANTYETNNECVTFYQFRSVQSSSTFYKIVQAIGRWK